MERFSNSYPAGDAAYRQILAVSYVEGLMTHLATIELATICTRG